MPVPGSGLGGQLMAGEEGTWATPATLNRSFPIDDESLKFVPHNVQGQALVAGSYTLQGANRAQVTSMVSGDINFDHTSRGIGLWWKHALGNVVTAQQGGTAAYKHTFTLGSQILGKGLTIQAGRPDATGTVHPRTYSGCKVNAWELTLANADILKFKASIVGQARSTAISLGTPSYPTANNIFHFAQGAITVGGSNYIGIKDFSLAGDNALTSSERTYVGNAGLISEPLRHNFAGLTGKFTADYVSTAMEDSFVADSELAIVLTFVTSVQIATGYFETLVLTSNGIRLNGDEATISGPDILNNPITFDNLSPKGGGTQFQVDLTTLDTVP